MQPDSQPQPLLSYAALQRTLSPARLQSYARSDDPSEHATISLYAWNLALTAALQPVLHCLEIAFRNEIARAAAKITETRGYRTATVASWLDADPTMLMENELGKVRDAKERLARDHRVITEDRLISKLDFGFWVALCRDAYADTRGDGPRLWPRMLKTAFRHRPGSVTTRAEVFHRFDRIRKFRNHAAHHEAVWNREYMRQHEYILESVGWMNPRLAEALRSLSPAPEVYLAGPDAYQHIARRLFGQQRSTDQG